MARPLLYHEGWGWRDGEDREDGALVKKVALSPVRLSEVKVGRICFGFIVRCVFLE